ncbi:MAG: hypothetical protein EBY29_10755 [Planctomycetes bacterium]|nr:hypothetical protein [Planctomycetota bacterium]
MPHFGILDHLIVRRITEPIIAQCAYFIACPRTRQAILVDPVRDPARYGAIANEIGLTITAILETHDPSDYKEKPTEYCGMKINDNPYYDV